MHQKSHWSVTKTARCLSRLELMDSCSSVRGLTLLSCCSAWFQSKFESPWQQTSQLVTQHIYLSPSWDVQLVYHLDPCGGQITSQSLSQDATWIKSFITFFFDSRNTCFHTHRMMPHVWWVHKKLEFITRRPALKALSDDRVCKERCQGSSISMAPIRGGLNSRPPQTTAGEATIFKVGKHGNVLSMFKLVTSSS